MSAVVKPVLAPASPAAVNAAAASFAALVAKLDYLGPEGIDLVRKAYRYADQAHLGQKRSSGEPYITHPIAVAAQCAEWRLDAQALIAALLVGLVDTFGKVLLPQVASMLVYVLMALVLLWKPQGLFKQ